MKAVSFINQSEDMKIKGLQIQEVQKDEDVLDCSVGNGYQKVAHGSLADVDLDHQADRRPEVKAYIERRYNKNGTQRVFSAGTFTTLKVKSAIKDVARTYKVPPSTTNYITAILDDDSLTWTDLMKIAATDKRIRDFLNKYPQVFEDILPILGQPRSSGIHASAIITIPEYIKGERVDCFDVLPIRLMDGILVSEISGADIDAIGILKNDCLAIQELTRISDVFNLIRQEYGVTYTMHQIATQYLNDPRVFNILQNGYTQGVFQMSGQGMTRFLKQLKPEHIGDLIAANALFRPATLKTGSAQGYVDCKNGLAEPEYLWGTYEILKETYGFLVFQEQCSLVVRKLGNLSLGDGVNLVKAISKKKVAKIQKYKEKYYEGIKQTGCPKEAADKVWSNIEAAASYCFNKCISGKEYLWGRHYDRGTHRKITIGDAYRTLHDIDWAKKNGRIPLRSKYLRNGYGTCWSLDANNRLVINRIVDIRYEGVKPLYRITLENGKTIDVTANHKHPTPNGVKRTDELIIGVDEMFYNAGYEKRDTSYRFTDKGGGRNDERYHSNKNIEHYTLNSHKGHEGFTNRDTAYTKLCYYENNLKKDYCEVCGKRDCRLEIHHKNGDHSDAGENYSNLQTLCVSCHKKAHYKMGRCAMGRKGLLTKTSKVISIEYIGEDEVYDVEMQSPYHTFVNGNGIVTHNSHATAYALTAYVGAWLKAHYPMPFYTVILRDCDDDKLPTLMNEMKAVGGATIVQPDINVSGLNFTPDYKNNKIYWSLTRIKWVGSKAVEYIVKERTRYGDFVNLEEFIRRIFRQKFVKFKNWDDPADGSQWDLEKNPVNARVVRNLIYAGAFDNCDHLRTICDRYKLLQQAAEMLGFYISEKEIPEGMEGKHYFWSQQQITLAGVGSVDYKRIWETLDKPNSARAYRFLEFDCLNNVYLKITKAAIAGTIVEVHEKTYKSRQDNSTKHFGKITLQQNTNTAEMVLWDAAWAENKHLFVKREGTIIAAIVNVKWSDYNERNEFQVNKGAFVTDIK